MALILTERFKRAYKKLPKEVQGKVKKSLKQLDIDPRYPALHVHPIRGTDGIFEARVDRKYRLSFEFSGDDLLLRNVDNHDECLKNP
ncbi:MAG: hypothetical protein MUO76_10675 [Anaerolineaceae bacterium]|nr:hypothetical protein [Anaerolineaceae bacterium]